MMRLFKLFFSIGIVSVDFCTSCNKYNKVYKSKDYEYKLKMADEYFAKKKYKIAQQLYEELFPVFKGTDNLKSCIIKMLTVFIT